MVGEIKDLLHKSMTQEDVSHLRESHPQVKATEDPATFEYEPSKKTRRRGVKIEIGGIKEEVLDQSEEEVKEYWNYRTPKAREELFQLIMDKATPKTVKVKGLELIFKITGQITEKHEVTVVNPEDVAKRGLEAAKELENFHKQIEGGDIERKDGMC